MGQETAQFQDLGIVICSRTANHSPLPLLQCRGTSILSCPARLLIGLLPDIEFHGVLLHPLGRYGCGIAHEFDKFIPASSK